jgi:hypothetical protein
MTKEVSSCVTIDVSSDYDTFPLICTSHYVFFSYIISSTWKFLDVKENLKILLKCRYIQYYSIRSTEVIHET